MKLRGFTLIELIIILVIIGILAVSAGPVFFDNSGTKSQVLRQQAMSILRGIQLQAMQDTTGNYSSVVSENTLGAPPFIEENNRQISNADNVTFSFSGSLPATIGFDGLGRPTEQCSGGCTITFTEGSGTSRDLCINKEGYINEC
ncbi:prepilin-type N-terminal cleavage/methylation domain-containing protein [Idiomarina sp. PL1-037]|uniref:prepilin-type N-terminal cleavage/methylation domain-containing protein n=1 Tax=Idiomarina sp. PL1-037 TaxID=3095365 RepID=UPI002ACC37BB|nr:prepilin-type N-terminal cleavage/methylation domain-containing protein [Idiomarina sp. PL1-037]WQC53347.1 prepilin-type N-terminal cleavage/methylation domain-containing protein [Idiomarina sp. PL1-037]